jgi:hypothetical protein
MPPEEQAPFDADNPFGDLPVDEGALIPDEGEPISPEQYAREYVGEGAVPEVAPAAAPVAAPEAVAPVAAPPVPDLAVLQLLANTMQAQQQAERTRATQAQEQAQRDAEARVAQEQERLRALRNSPEWRNETMRRYGLDPAKVESRIALEHALRADDLEDELQRNRSELTGLRDEFRKFQESMESGKKLIVAQNSVESFVREAKLPDQVAKIVEHRVVEMVRNGWDAKDALQLISEPLLELAKASAKPTTPTAPRPKELTPQERAALSASSLAGRGGGRTRDTNPLSVLANARSNLFGQRRN